MSDNIPVDVQRDPSTSTAQLSRAGSAKEEILASRPDKNAPMSEGMSHFEAAVSFVFGVFLPTVDVGSDLWLAIKLISGVKCRGRVQYFTIWGGVSFICPSLSFLFVTYHWWKMEKPKDRLKTLPFLLAQVWPQYRMVKLIHKGYNKKHPKHKEACSLRASKAKKKDIDTFTFTSQRFQTVW